MRTTAAVAFSGIFVLCFSILGCSTSTARTPSSEPARVEYREGELTIVELKTGSGEPCRTGQDVTVHYTAWLYKADAPGGRGKEVDTTRGGGEPFAFRLGRRDVIKGWEMGVIGMRVGGRRTLVIPPSLAYGESGAGKNIPSFAVLVFDVELMAIKDPPANKETQTH